LCRWEEIMTSKNGSFLTECHRLLQVKTPILWVATWEEARLRRQVQVLADKAFGRPIAFLVWTSTEGLVDGRSGEPFADTASALTALDTLLRMQDNVIALFYDLHPFLSDPRVVRRLRDVYEAFKSSYSALFLSSPRVQVPLDLDKSLVVLELPLPEDEERGRILDGLLSRSKGLALETEDVRDAVIRATAGLTADEVDRALSKVFLGQEHFGVGQLGELYEEKRQIVRKSGILDYVPPRIGLEQVGGLGTLKNWLSVRRRFFTEEAREFGISVPKGILLTGVSGCGKSIAVQAVSSYWGLPMVRLDMNRVYGAEGGPELGLQRAVETAEAVAPCILWIDEIETAIVGMGGDPTGLATRIFSSFLTWMQEKTKVVFVAATANEIHMLPPELLRKGRFDEIFFVDLPGEEERREIFAVHLAKRGHDPEEFSLLNLAKSTQNFTGAEIEHVVVSALYEAFEENRSLETDDLYLAVGRTIPLATTMAEKIKEIRRWADQRALRAS